MSRTLRGAWPAGALGAGLVLAAGSALAAGMAPGLPPTSPAVITDFRAGNIAQMAERSALLARGEARLAQGDTAAAIEQFDRAAMMLHAPDTEMALVRAYLQSGNYRRALAFCAHTAGAHRETVAPSALYAWLLQLGGQGAYADRVLSEARKRSGDERLGDDSAANGRASDDRADTGRPDNYRGANDGGANDRARNDVTASERTPSDRSPTNRAADSPVLAAVARALRSPAPRADDSLLAGAHRMAPYAVQRGGDAPVPASAAVVASGSLIDGGRHALVPLAAIGSASTVWLRNGLGVTSSATLARRLDGLGLALLALGQPLGLGDTGESTGSGGLADALQPAARDPFAGSPGFAIGYVTTPDAEPAWPWLHAGFFGGLAQPEAATGERRLGIAMPPGPRGGPVFDAAGRLAGLALGGSGSAAGDRLVPITALRQALGAGLIDAPPLPPVAASAAATPSRLARMPNDEVYERALRVAVQVIVAR